MVFALSGGVVSCTSANDVAERGRTEDTCGTKTKLLPPGSSTPVPVAFQANYPGGVLPIRVNAWVYQVRADAAVSPRPSPLVAWVDNTGKRLVLRLPGGETAPLREMACD